MHTHTLNQGDDEQLIHFDDILPANIFNSLFPEFCYFGSHFKQTY